MMADPSREITLLVADDLEPMRKLIVRNLEQIGYRSVLQAANGVEALALLENRPGIAALITDWNMPLMSGLELLRLLRAHPRLGKLPILMLTGEMSRPQVEEAIAAGVSSFLIKPFTASSLQLRLRQILAHLDTPGSRSSTRSATSRPQPPAHTAPLDPPWVAAEPIVAASDSAPCVLVVDDVAATIDQLVGLLQSEYRVIAARGGREALQLLANVTPDLILLDVMMPAPDGFEVCRQLKANPAWSEIPVIFLTANDDSKSVVDGLRLGAVDYLAKPLEPMVLRTRVAGQIARRHAYAALQRQVQLEYENGRLREQVERMARHDLKSPIAGIVNFTEALLQDSALPAAHAELVQAIHESAWSVLDLINLSLDLYRIERGAYTLVPVRIDLFQLVRRILKEREAELVGKRLHLSFAAKGRDGERSQACWVDGDPLLSYSLFANLIKNAIEASPSGGRLAINMECTDDRQALVGISNQGAVPAAIRDRFFDKFSTAGKPGGSGIGTYSAALFARAQGGSLQMESCEQEDRTLLSVRIPLSTAD